MGSADLAATGTGLLFGLSLIVAVGAQNLYVLRQGIAREHVGMIVLICSGSDALLMAFGIAGGGVAIGRHHAVLDAVRVAGAAFLFGYALFVARRALGPTKPAPEVLTATSSRSAIAGACLAFTWLNPAVYLDTVLLVGSVANTLPGRQWWFGAGAAGGSVVWFCGLGYGARLLSGLFARPAAFRALDAFTSVVMVVIGIRVLVGR